MKKLIYFLDGYKIKDYRQGVATDKYNRDVKIGKILNKNNQPELLDKFNNNKNRKASQGKYNIVISRHPHDVAGMSTDRGWTSCTNMEGGAEKHTLRHDIQKGTHVAYLVHEHVKEIKNPVARIALRPYQGTSTKHKIIRPDTVTYGDGNQGFKNSVHKWTEQHFPLKELVYRKIEGPYQDDGKEEFISNNPEHISKALNDKHSDVRSAAIQHPKATVDHLKQGLKDKKAMVCDLAKEKLAKLKIKK